MGYKLKKKWVSLSWSGGFYLCDGQRSGGRQILWRWGGDGEPYAHGGLIFLSPICHWAHWIKMSKVVFNSIRDRKKVSSLWLLPPSIFCRSRGSDSVRFKGEDVTHWWRIHHSLYLSEQHEGVLSECKWNRTQERTAFHRVTTFSVQSQSASSRAKPPSHYQCEPCLTFHLGALARIYIRVLKHTKTPQFSGVEFDIFRSSLWISLVG